MRSQERTRSRGFSERNRLLRCVTEETMRVPPPPVDHLGTRRRGEVLMRAIFAAALEQLRAVGWRRLTMEGVAACAQTGKAALYRRWASKEDLIVAAIENSLPSPPGVPDLGSVRAELSWLMNRIHTTMYSAPGCALRAIMNEIEHEHAKVLHELFQSM